MTDDWSETFIQLLTARFSSDPSAPEALRTGKPPVPLWPLASERAYAKYISTQLKALFKFAVQEIRPKFNSWAEPYRADSFGSDFSEFQRRLLDLQHELFLSEPAKRNTIASILKLGNKTSSFHSKQFQNSIRFALGTSFLPNESWVSASLQTWAEQNFGLISKLSTTAIQRINELTKSAVTSGSTWKTLSTQLQQSESTITKSRANLIARDQIAKLNSTLTQKRQQYAGINAYEWETAYDERVRGRPGGKYSTSRPSHWAMQDAICSWDDPTIQLVNGKWIPRPTSATHEHPGQPIQCRCSALPNFSSVIPTAVNRASDPSRTKQQVSAIKKYSKIVKPIQSESGFAPNEKPIDYLSNTDEKEIPKIQRAVLGSHQSKLSLSTRNPDDVEFLPFSRSLKAFSDQEEYTKAQRAIWDYSDEEYKRINRELRDYSWTPETYDEVESIKQYIQEFKNEKPIRVARGINHLALKELKLKDLDVGSTIKDDGFLSSSLKRSIADGFAHKGVILEFTLPPGSSALVIGANNRELEMIAPPGATLVVTSIDKSKSPWVAQANFIPGSMP